MTEYAFYGDDFTGSVDSLLQHRRAGLNGILVTSPEHVADHVNSTVVGIAGVARSLSAERQAEEVGSAIAALLTLEPRVIQYKTSSTVDSSDSVGSIGLAIETARRFVGEGPVVACFAQPDFGRYTVFGTHFARDGDQIYRLDRQPTMSAHPMTPMHEADLRIVLRAQTALAVRSLEWTEYGRPGAVRAAIDSGSGILVADALTDGHLDELAAAVLQSGTRFVVGSGGISGALGRAMRASERVEPLPVVASAAPGPTLVINGSTSERTQAQIEATRWGVFDAFTESAPHRTAEALSAGRSVVLSSVSSTRGRTSSDDVNRALVEAARTVLAAAPVGRLVVCGGDTSGHVLRGLGVTALVIEAAPWGNAPLCRIAGEHDLLRGLSLVLKGGQMGHLNLLSDIAYGRNAV